VPGDLLTIAETTHPGIPATKMHVLNIPGRILSAASWAPPRGLLVEAEVRHGRFYPEPVCSSLPIELPVLWVLYDLEMAQRASTTTSPVWAGA
jgi:hypothetical protein